MNYKLRLIGNILTSREEKNFTFSNGQKMTISPVGDGKTVNISLDDEETYKTKGADAFLKRVEKIFKKQTDHQQDGVTENRDDIFQVLTLYENCGPRRK